MLREEIRNGQKEDRMFVGKDGEGALHKPGWGVRALHWQKDNKKKQIKQWSCTCWGPKETQVG